MNEFHLPLFVTWLNDNQAQILHPCQETEVLRYRIKGAAVTVVRRAKNGDLCMPSRALSDFCCYVRNEPQRLPSPTKTPPLKSRQRSRVRHQIQARDGTGCFYCGFSSDEMNLEHLLARSQSGTNTLFNLALACAKGNTMAGNLPVVSKVLLRDKIRLSGLTCNDFSHLSNYERRSTQ